METIEPFDILLELEQRCQVNAAGLPTLDKSDDEWVGVGFRIGEDKLIAPMSEIEEILELPDFTYVPGVKSWMVGVANVRGGLLPLMDLKGFILGEDIKNRKKGRVIVIDYKGFNTGVIVEEVYGMKHFISKEQSKEIPDMHENVSKYVGMAFNQEGDSWPVFSFQSMTQDERLAQASL
ncbi:MAG: chemotaxis protein CheW [Gammaproteobacteria bacterium]